MLIFLPIDNSFLLLTRNSDLQNASKVGIRYFFYLKFKLTRQRERERERESERERDRLTEGGTAHVSHSKGLLSI